MGTHKHLASKIHAKKKNFIHSQSLTLCACAVNGKQFRVQRWNAKIEAGVVAVISKGAVVNKRWKKVGFFTARA